MKGTLILDRTEAREDGVRIFVFEYTDEADRNHYLQYKETHMPTALAEALCQGDIVRAEWNEDCILSGTIDAEETKAASKEAEDLLAKLFAKKKK